MFDFVDENVVVHQNVLGSCWVVHEGIAVLDLKSSCGHGRVPFVMNCFSISL